MDQSLKRSCELADESATVALAEKLATALAENPRNWIVLLQGELGAGKSTLARAMIRSLGHTGSVPSPTYTLVEPYKIGDMAIYHIDLYRISSADELEFLGWADLGDGLRLIEWPERIPGLEAQADLKIVLSYAGSGRAAELVPLSAPGAALLAGTDLR